MMIVLYIRIPAEMKQILDELAAHCELTLQAVSEAVLAKGLAELQIPAITSMEKLYRLLDGIDKLKGREAGWLASELSKAERDISSEQATPLTTDAAENSPSSPLPTITG